MVEEFLERPERPLRVNARSRMLDVRNIVSNMEALVNLSSSSITTISITAITVNRIK